MEVLVACEPIPNGKCVKSDTQMPVISFNKADFSPIKRYAMQEALGENASVNRPPHRAFIII